MQIRKVSNTRKIESYVRNLGEKPFISTDVKDETGVCENTVSRKLRELELAGKVKQIGWQDHYKIYVKAKVKNPPKKYTFTPIRDKLQLIMDQLGENGTFPFLIVKKTGIKKTTTGRYLKALLVMGCAHRNSSRRWEGTDVPLPEKIETMEYYERIYNERKKEVENESN